mgnify:CR=1 FL=1
MLAKKYRLPIQEFVGKAGQSRKGRHFLLKIFNPNNVYSRFGVVISKKVAVKATTRNRIRRIVFDFFSSKLDLPTGDYLVIVLSGADNLSKEELIGELIKSISLR